MFQWVPMQQVYSVYKSSPQEDIYSEQHNYNEHHSEITICIPQSTQFRLSSQCGAQINFYYKGSTAMCYYTHLCIHIVLQN